LTHHSSSLHILDQFRREWDEIFVREKGENEVERSEYLSLQRRTHGAVLSGSKLLQVNKTLVCILGGRQENPSLLARDYEVSRSCLIVDIYTGEICQKASMEEGRDGFGQCLLGHLIYVVGGDSDEKEVDSVERYDLLRDRWSQLPCSLPDTYTFGITVVAIKLRFVFGFGGYSRDEGCPPYERFLRLDTLTNTAWQSLYIQNPLFNAGFNYGVFPIQESDDSIEFLVFGGHNSDYACVKSTYVFQTKLTDFSLSKYQMLRPSANKYQ
jgi:hypothetical protein